MPDLSTITENLDQRDDGIWIARSRRDVSYPDEGNEASFAVEDTSYWFAHRNKVITNLVNNFSPSAAFYDIGGGNGCVSYALQSAGIDVVLVEPGPDGALNAKKRGVRTVIQSTLEDAGFARNALPSAGLFDVVEHIENDAEFLGLICDYLQPQGTLYITVPAFPFLWSNDDVHAGHYRRYTMNTLSSLLRQSGFDVKYCGYLFSFLVPPIFLTRTIPSKMGFRKAISQATTTREHASGSGVVNRIIQRILRFELDKVRQGIPIRIGSSCIAVATKRSITGGENGDANSPQSA